MMWNQYTRPLACLACLTGLALPTSAGERVERSVAVPPDPVVQVENTRGEVRIRGWDKDEVTVTGELDDLAEEFIFDVDGKNVLIKVKMPRRDVNWGDGSNLVIHVPHMSRIRFEGVSSDVEVKDIEHGAQIRTVSGDVDITSVNEMLIVNSVSGDVDVSGGNGRVQVSSISGDLKLKLTANEVRLDTVSGDLTADLEVFELLSGRSVSGEMEIEGTLAPGGRIELSSVSGDVDLTLAKPVNAEISVRSGIGGDIRNAFNDTAPRDMFPSQQVLQTRAGDGSGRITIGTVSGDVRLN